MKLDEINNGIITSAENKKKEMLEKELEMLDSFYERRAITKETYDKGVTALKNELEAMENK